MSSKHTNNTISISECIENTSAFCAKCHAPGTDDDEGRLLTCSRCKLARYCCRNCQREHHLLHKKGCKRIARVREQLNDATIEESRAETFILLADTFVEVTYRSCHTLEFSVNGLASAIRYYMEALQYPNTRCQIRKVAFLFASIGQDEAAISVLCYDTLHNNNKDAGEATMPNVIPRVNPNDNVLNLIPADTEWNATNLVTLLFIKMKLVVAQTIRIGDKDETSMAQMHQVRDCMDPTLLNAIQHCIPLSPVEAPSLFDAETPFEFWCLVQDLFFMTPGVNDLFPDDDDDDEYS